MEQKKGQALQEEMNALTVGVLHSNRLTTEAVDAINALISRYSEYLGVFSSQNALKSRIGMAMRTLKAAGNQLENLRLRVYMIEAPETAAKKKDVLRKVKAFKSGQRVSSKDLK